MCDIETKMLRFMLEREKKRRIKKEDKEWHEKRTKREFFPGMW